MLAVNPEEYANLYASFHRPISTLNCGEKCAPYNENRVPFCCDTRHAVPTAYQTEWDYLQANSRLWHLWNPVDSQEIQKIRSETPPGHLLIECLGHLHCERSFRSITCRAFPFFPYLNRQGEFLGMSYYWEYEDRCWVISHLQTVTMQYRAEFIAGYEQIFNAHPQERENFRYHSAMMRRIFGRKHRTIPLLHRNGFAYKITPRNGRLRRVPLTDFPPFGAYLIAAKLAFPDELEEA